MATHTLKSYPHFFESTLSGIKKHELRSRAEFAFYPCIGDVIELVEYDKEENKYTGRTCFIQITWISPHPEALKPGHVAFSFVLKKKWWKKLF